MIAIVVYAVTVPGYLGMFGFNGLEPQMLPACFNFGALLALNKHEIRLNVRTLAGLIRLCIIVHGTVLFQALFYASLFYGSVLAATLPLVCRAHLPGDSSYGVYLCGFPLQQPMIFLFPHWGMHQNEAAVLAATLIAGCCSWFLVERAGIRIGRWITAG